MKNIFLMCSMMSLLACVKVQKKTDIEPEKTVQSGPAVAVESRPEPVILFFDETMSLNKDTEIIADEIHLKSNARIYTNQFSLKLQATSIFIDYGVTIQTFAEGNQIAALETPGLDGGVVHVVANDIHGNLQVFMNGQSGGKGLGGWTAFDGGAGSFSIPTRAACAPNGGKDSGVSGSFFLEVKQSQEFSISTTMKVAEGGAIGPVYDNDFSLPVSAMGEYKQNQNQNCQTVPKIGKAGIAGQICLKLTETDLMKCEKF